MDIYQRLQSLEAFGIKLGLQNIQRLLNELGNPQDRFPSILIAGTNGKGSVSAMLTQILSSHGLRTGHYTSPHLIDVRERIRIGRELIPENEFENVLRIVFERIDQMQEFSPTYFEALTAAAFYFFAKQKVDFGVIEVGLGGRYDSTNVLHPKLSIITTIDYDHEQYLGKSLTEIASEKAGIIKPETPVVTGILPSEAFDQIREFSGAQKSNLLSVHPNDLQDLHLENGFPVFYFRPWNERVRVSLRGKHQAENAAIALKVCEQLKDISLDRSTVIRALNEVEWPARLHMIKTTPLTLLDCAHNPMSARSLAQFLSDMQWHKAICFFTAMKDKNISRMIQIMAPYIKTIYLTRVEPYDRCATIDQLVNGCEEAGVDFKSDKHFIRAFRNAEEDARNANLPLVIFGSIYLAGQVLANCKSPLL